MRYPGSSAALAAGERGWTERIVQGVIDASTGRFEVAGVPPGNWTITVFAHAPSGEEEEGEAQVSPADEREVVIRLAPATSVDAPR